MTQQDQAKGEVRIQAEQQPGNQSSTRQSRDTRKPVRPKPWITKKQP